jgi:hypothetical protein
VLTTKRPAAALLALAFFSIAMLCAETSRLAACDTVSLHAPATQKGHSPVAGQRKALKRSVYAENSAAPSYTLRPPARYLSPEVPPTDVGLEVRQLGLRERMPVPKISTNLFLSVLNL